MAISLSNVSFAYHYPKKNTPKYVLKDVSLDISLNNEFITILGHTGSGKSTLVQLFNALLQSNEGNVEVFGRKISKNKNTKLKEIRKRVGLVFQFPEYQVFEETIIKDVMFGPKNFGLDNPKELAEDALEKVGISKELYEESPFMISGGQLRRVAIAGILASNPDILIFDEPTVGLDPLGKKELLKMLKILNEEYNKTIIIITHDMEVVAQVAKRVIVLSKGNIVFDDNKENLFSNDEFVNKFGLDYPNSIKIMKQLKEKLNIDIDIYQFSIEDCYNELVRGVGHNE